MRPSEVIEAAAAEHGCKVEKMRFTKRGLQASVSCEGPAGKQYGFVDIDVESLHFNAAASQLIRMEVLDCTAKVRAMAHKPADVAAVQIGWKCPTHGGAIEMIDLREWMLKCSHSTHEIPERITGGIDRDGMFKVRTRRSA